MATTTAITIPTLSMIAPKIAGALRTALVVCSFVSTTLESRDTASCVV